MTSINRNTELTDKEILDLIKQVESEGLIQAPVRMKQEILERAEHSDKEKVVQTHRISGSTQLFFYSLKVCGAVAAALYVLFMIPTELSHVEVDKTLIVQENEEDSISLGQLLNNGLREVNELINRKIWPDKK